VIGSIVCNANKAGGRRNGFRGKNGKTKLLDNLIFEGHLSRKEKKPPLTPPSGGGCFALIEVREKYEIA
jgi:hypothetical protein